MRKDILAEVLDEEYLRKTSSGNVIVAFTVQRAREEPCGFINA